ncbi:enoyl-CoA hydratase [Marinibaculum pumilum]|uniref:Enoyl-CoA hydratase domain-containing protein 3, mitochondrial n=1 Tax=Marinibaculum pumilum TaxID=1766165 RepID=A0ABV7KUP8_9PROT
MAEAAQKADPAASAAQSPVRREDSDGIAILTLQKPATRNSLSSATMAVLQELLDACAGDPAVRVIVLAHEGPAFSAGHDLREVSGLIEARDTAAQHALLTQCSTLMQQVQKITKPVIAEIAGIATAAGCQLAAACDLVVAGRSARFGTPGVNIGLFCSTPMVALSRAVASPKHAMEMLLTGDLVDAEHAFRIGLVNRVVDDAGLREATLALAQQIASKSQATIAIGKAAFYRQLGMPLAEAYAFTSDVMVGNLAIDDANEGICAFIEKRSPNWTDR